jgi:uncharacterized protein YndB with AHSA1/START domain
MKNTLEITTPSDRELALKRVFNAPRALVWEALTTPALLKRWLGTRDGWTMAVCDIDLKVGGTYRYLWRGPDKQEMGMRGVYREIMAPERLVATEVFDQKWYEGDAVDTMTLAEKAGKTTLTTTVRYASKDVRDAVLRSPMESGVADGYDALETLLAAKQSNGAV